MAMKRRVVPWVFAISASACGAAARPAVPPAPAPVVALAAVPVTAAQTDWESFELPEVAARDALLHLDAPDGPVIGRLVAGARVIPRARSGPYAQVLVEGVERPVMSEGGMRALELLAWIDVRELVERAALPAEPSVRHVRDFHTWMQLAPGEGRFAWTGCGPLRVVEDRRDAEGRLVATRVAQTRNGFELVGWTESPLARRRGDHACPAQVIAPTRIVGLLAGRSPPPPEPLPPGVVEASVVPAGRITALARSRASVYWIAETDDGAVCEDWRLAVRGRATALEHDARVDGGLSRTSFAVEVSDGSLVLLGPSSRWIRHPRTGGWGEMSFGCADQYDMVGGDDEHIVLLPGQHLGGVRGYRPEETESWFLTRAACEAAIERAPSIDEALALAHKGC